MDKRAVIMWLFVLCFLGVLFVSWRIVGIQKSVYTDANEEVITGNPLIGFAVSADYREAVGDNSLVYIDILWKDIEPQKGQYDFTGIYEENYIEEYKALGKKAVLRFICDKPSADPHMDIPDWLYEETADGTFYDTSYGKGYSPDYENEFFLQAHGKVIQAIADEFGQDNFLAYVQLGSLGHWGEWHVKGDEGIVPMPSEETSMKYVRQYVEAFPNIRLMMRRPFLGVQEYGLGVFNDMTGDEDDTNTWLGWLINGGEYTEPRTPYMLYAIEEFWLQGAVGGEFTSALSWKDMLGTKLEQTRSLITDSHMSFIGPKVPHYLEAPDYQEAADEIKALLGYKLGIERAVIRHDILFATWNFEIKWNNKGIAPIYYNWPVYLYFYDEEGRLVQKKHVEMDITKIVPDSSVTVKTKVKMNDAKIGRITVGIEDPMFKKPVVRLNNERKHDEFEVVIYEMIYTK